MAAAMTDMSVTSVVCRPGVPPLGRASVIPGGPGQLTA